MSRTDKDRPSTWATYSSGLCKTCLASCCCMPVEVRAKDLVRLKLVTEDEVLNSIKKVSKKLKKEGVITSYREGSDFFMLTQKANSDCYFLDTKTRLCTVYENRPDTCREFPTLVGPKINFCPYQKKD